MADNPDITAGTTSVTVGTKAVTGVGTFWSTDEIRSGDLFGSDGYPGARIDTVNSDTSITLKDNWRGATLPAGSSYYIRYQPDGSRYAALLAAVRKILTQPLLTAFAGLTGATDTIAYFTGPATMATVAFKAWARSLLGLTMAADKLPYGSGANTMALTDFTAAGRTLIGAASAVDQLAALGINEQLSATRTYYVRPDGSDSNNGLANTAGGAFLTLQKAWNQMRLFSQFGYAVVINVANGTYAPLNATGYGITGPVSIIGNITTPASCVVSGTNNFAVLFDNVPAGVTLDGFKLTTTGGANNALIARNSAVVYLGAMDFGASSGDHINCIDRATVTHLKNYTISGSAGLSHHHAFSLGGIQCTGRTVTLTGTPDFGGYFCGLATSAWANYAGTTFVGTATGQKFFSHLGGVLNVGGTGFSFLPGNVAGVYKGGNYDDKIDAVETGIWSPALIMGYAASPGITYAAQIGRYLKTGNLVWVRGRLILSNKGSGTGLVSIVGFPFAGETGVISGAVTIGRLTSVTGVTGMAHGALGAGVATAADLYFSSATGSANFDAANLTNGSDLSFTMVYSTASL